MVRDDRTVHIRVVIAPAVNDNAILLREPVELRQPLTVILKASMDKNNRSSGAFFDVMEVDVTGC